MKQNDGPAAEARQIVTERVREHVRAVEALARPDAIGAILDAARAIGDSFAAGGKLLAFGNGGSAADAQHLVGELVGRYMLTRRALPAIALTTNSTNLTAIANDLGYGRVFTRQVEALGSPGDVAVGLSTSGDSPNVVAGIEAAKALGLATIAFTGRDGGRLRSIADLCVRAGSTDTPRIQEAHITAIHIICELVELQVAGS